MTLRARPDLVGDRDGQKINMERIMHFEDIDLQLDLPEVAVELPYDTLPPAAFGLNGHDILPYRPDPKRIPYAVTGWNRESQGQNSTRAALTKAGDLRQKWLESYYPDLDQASIELRSYHFSHSSEENFAGLTDNGSTGGLPNRQSNRANADDFVALMNRAEIFGRQDESDQPLVWVLQFSEGGTSTAIHSFGLARRMWPHVDLRMSVYSPYHLVDKMPFFGTRELDPATTHGCWGHYSFEELAQRVSNLDVHGLGENQDVGVHLDAHTQLVFFIDQIQRYKAELAVSGLYNSEALGGSRTKAACNRKWALALFLSHAGSRGLSTTQTKGHGLYRTHKSSGLYTVANRQGRKRKAGPTWQSNLGNVSKKQKT
jgi:hypothetical protein